MRFPTVSASAVKLELLLDRGDPRAAVLVVVAECVLATGIGSMLMIGARVGVFRYRDQTG